MGNDPIIVLILLSSMPSTQLTAEERRTPVLVFSPELIIGSPGMDSVYGDREDAFGNRILPPESLLIELAASSFGMDTIDIGDEPGFDFSQDDAPRSYRPERSPRMKPRWKRRNRRK